MLAEFDIDVGCVVREQYPSEIKCRETSILSELMLPEGSHKYAEDWNLFTLHSASEDAEQLPADAGLKYAFNMVRNKRDTNVRRGAIVKAIAVVTTADQLDLLWPVKPLLRDALEALHFLKNLNLLLFCRSEGTSAS